MKRRIRRMGGRRSLLPPRTKRLSDLPVSDIKYKEEEEEEKESEE